MNDTTIMPLKCLNCKKDIPLPWGIVKEISYTHYSYCEECLRKGLKALRALKAVRKCIEKTDTCYKRFILETLEEVEE